MLHVFEVQLAALTRTKKLVEENLSDAISILLQCKGKIVVTGIGKSGIIAHKISATLASTGSPSVFINANEALHGDLGILSEGDVVIMLSKSGTTTELIKMLPKIKLLRVPVIGIFGKSDTRLADQLDLILDASVEEEGSPFNLAPMASTTVSLVIGDCLAANLMKQKGLKEGDFASNHPAGQLGKNLLLKASDIMHEGNKMPTAKPDQTIKEAIINLTRKNLGGLCVVDEEGLLVGFITDGDIRKYLSIEDDLQRPVSEIMTRNPVSVQPDMTLGQVMDLMENPIRQIYVAPVVEAISGKAIGVIRMHDMLQP
ncbi:MAG TPA: KpsF/GutQ family sugar-phosphate isomerase [Catalimonadaceae bacterium]|nr:KpsF/GutQ family sugar-phosphate isomerase [Catalimonadaceae bacterium]